MATGKAKRKPRTSHTSRKRARVVVALVLIGGLLAFIWRAPIRDYSVTATAFSARVACSCRYVAGRDLSQCHDDLEPGMGLVMLSEDDEAQSVTARIPLLASQTATWRKGPGCVLEPWED